MRAFYPVAALVATIALLVAGCGGGGSSESSDQVITAAHSPEDLATIELGHRPSADDATLRQISVLLDKLRVCANTRRQLVDFTADAYQGLDDAGIHESPTEILEVVTRGINEPDALPPDKDCEVNFLIHVALRKSAGHSKL